MAKFCIAKTLFTKDYKRYTDQDHNSKLIRLEQIIGSSVNDLPHCSDKNEMPI